MTLTRVVVEIEKRAEPEIGACPRCGALGALEHDLDAAYRARLAKKQR